MYNCLFVHKSNLICNCWNNCWRLKIIDMQIFGCIISFDLLTRTDNIGNYVELYIKDLYLVLSLTL